MKSSADSSTPQRRLLRHSVLRSLLVFAIITSIAGLCWRQHLTHRAAAEQDALDFVRLNGFTNEGYRHTLVSSLLTIVLPPSNARPSGVQKLVGVAFPRDRMNDVMAHHLVNIRHLQNITLYPADPSYSGPDFAATATTQHKSLRDLDLPLSEGSIVSLEEHFPDLRIVIAERPAVDAASELTGDVTE